MKFAFFGTDNFSTHVLDELKKGGFIPDLIITIPDRKTGRKMTFTPSKVKVWAEENNINYLQPEKLNEEFQEKLDVMNFDLFVVASYGKIIPKKIIETPKYGSLNVHPSLLPRFRGASPIESQILEDERTVGVTIMLMDEKMDHGPIVAQEVYLPEEIDESDGWPPKASELEEKLAKLGGKLLTLTIPEWIEGNIDAQQQEHQLASFTKKIKKEDALINLKDDPYENLLKIRSYDKWPRAYFFADKDGKEIRVVITEAHMEGNKLVIDKVIPEGKKEMGWQDFERNLD